MATKFDKESKIQAVTKHDTRHFINSMNNDTTSQEKNGIYFHNITSQKNKRKIETNIENSNTYCTYYTI